MPTSRVRIYLAQVVCLVILLACLYGTYVHFHGNWQFASELNPGGSTVELAKKALLGDIPLLAPMILSIPAVLLGIGTLDHPVLASDTATE